MSGMTEARTWELTWGSGPMTVAERDAIPADGRRHELIDGILFMSPAPGWGHQEVVMELAALLRRDCPRGIRAMGAPFDVQTSEYDVVQPDVLVTRYDDLTPRNLPVAPLLAVEVASPSTRLHDRNTKRAHYERIGVPSYWLIDTAEPGRIEVLELDGAGPYRQVALVEGDERLVVERPFPFTVRPTDLLAGLRPD